MLYGPNKLQTPSLARRARISSRGAFTLIEMVVVVAIIALLLAIAVPVSTGLLNSQKAKATKLTLQTLELAIDTFGSEKPINSDSYKGLYGPFPPSPVTAVYLDSTKPSYKTYGPSEFEAKSDNSLTTFTADPGGTKMRFESLVREHLAPKGSVPEWYYNYDNSWHKKDYPDTDKYLSIETLTLFLRQLSPQSRQSLDRMQKYQTNRDSDRIAWDADGDKTTQGETITDLFEINDAWGNPLRYSVQSPVVNKDGMALKIRWELRSAGPDGKFNATFYQPDGSFLPEEQAGDDVILRGP